MHGRPIRASLGSEPYGSALVCTEPKKVESKKVMNLVISSPGTQIALLTPCATERLI